MMSSCREADGENEPILHFIWSVSAVMTLRRTHTRYNALQQQDQETDQKIKKAQKSTKTQKNAYSKQSTVPKTARDVNY